MALRSLSRLAGGFLPCHLALWIDVYNGNTMVFVFVAAAGALQRKPIATLAYIELCLLMPRPIMLPLLIWIVWHQPEWRYVLLLGRY